jgi:hypothetical protein
MSDVKVWYVCYGSNLCYDRFLCYLEGGKAAGSRTKQPGARDSSEPTDERAVFIPYYLYFSQKSMNWHGGGVAFLDPRRDDSVQTLGRAYLISREQFEDVFRQENRNQDLCIDWDTLLNAGTQNLGDGWYHQIIKTGELEGKPILTFTHSGNSDERGINPPSEQYLRTIIAGLFETYNLGKEGMKKYLRDMRGIKDKIKPATITRLWQDVVDEDVEE